MLRRISLLILVVLLLVTASTASFAWKFASIADSRGSTNGVNTTVLQNIVNRINAENVDLVIFAGDAVSGSSSDSTLSSQMDTWLAIMNTLNCPYYFTPGNHEIGTSTAQENVLRTKLNQPLNGPAGDLEMVYSFDHQNAHFVALNSNHYGQYHHVQRSWLTTDLAANVQPHIFVFAHEPGYPSGPHASDSLNYYLSERDDFWNIVTRAGVSMYFTGHEHLYQRKKFGAITQVINGTCGAPLHTGYPDTIAQYHYVVVTVDGSNVSCVAKNDSGTVIDTWNYTQVQPLTVNCDSAKLQPNGTYVTMNDKVVTYLKGSAAYVEEADRSAGFRINGVSGISTGDKIEVFGTLQTNASGEREIQQVTVIKKSSGNTIPKPVCMTTRNLIGGTRGYNLGLDGTVGCNTSSLLVRICGKVTAVGSGANAGMFYIDDGSDLRDGTSWDGSPNKGVRVVWGGPVSIGEIKTVTGICSAMKNDTGQLQRMVYSTDMIVLQGFTAYNDVVYSSNSADGHPALQPNVTTFNIGSTSPGPSSGMLKDFATGTDTGVTAAFAQAGTVVWQPSASSGGTNCNPGTDAYNTFNSTTASLNGVVYYGSTGWYVDLTFTGLNPTKTYEFATSANRNDATYTNRITKFTIFSADAFVNASTSGVTIDPSGASSSFNTGYNTVNGYVARWTGIRCGTDGSFRVRAEVGAGGDVQKAYAFSAFKLVQNP